MVDGQISTLERVVSVCIFYAVLALYAVLIWHGLMRGTIRDWRAWRAKEDERRRGFEVIIRRSREASS
jgi:hypothetical protein